ncbi:extracellular solute-binding protein [Carnobacterium sp. PL17GRE32]|uniref:extracellular solute-binding protein n=1 Tax=Carnobacterium sp. PL17GRE32 TaxID=2592355 RepID=UPI0011EC3327|nr:extracellular solute-binding protein [Carnobacterium sp. PL17GRE32]KAF3306824.1 extracellular solute-binding protein [Carnobacterium sp. PL17GRE32]
MKWFKKLRYLGIASASVLALAACGNTEETSTNGKTVIEFFNQKKEMEGTLEEIIQDFERLHPDIDVQMTSVPDAGTVLKTRMLSGDVPDVINLYPQNIDFQEWANAGFFYDMTGQDYLDNLKNQYADKYAINGKVYNVPLTANVSGIYYNKTKFEALGLKAPETWDEFVQLVDDIKAAGETPFAIAGTEGWTLNGYHQLSLITTTGSADAANEYLRYSQPNSISADDDILKADAAKLDLLADEGNQQANWKGASYNDAIVAFTSEDALMTTNGSWALAAMRQQEPTFEISTFAFPGEEPGQSATVGAGDFALSIAAETENLEAAETFVAYMTTPEPMQKYYDVDGSPIAVIGVEEDSDSPLKALNELAFTDKHYVWMAQHWTSEDDFFTATANYLMTQDIEALADELNAFFNPMKADLD